MDDADDAEELLRDIVMVAHDGNRFDIPCLFHPLNTQEINISDIPFKRWQIDTITSATRYSIVLFTLTLPHPLIIVQSIFSILHCNIIHSPAPTPNVNSLK